MSRKPFHATTFAPFTSTNGRGALVTAFAPYLLITAPHSAFLHGRHEERASMRSARGDWLPERVRPRFHKRLEYMTPTVSSHLKLMHNALYLPNLSK